MSSLTLQLAYDGQKILSEHEIPSAVTGHWALNYHGVDIALHDIELCVPTAQLNRATEALEAQYTRLKACSNPDLYHCYRRGAKEFLLANIWPRMTLFLVTDEMLSLQLPTDMEDGLTTASAHEELRGYFEDVEPDVLARITWPSLASFLEGWLKLSVRAQAHDSVDEVIYLMYAEKMIDANEIDEGWCERSFGDERVVGAAKRLLEGKSNRLMQDRWVMEPM